jgi:Zn-dependent M32 family carboxypeptidase
MTKIIINKKISDVAISKGLIKEQKEIKSNCEEMVSKLLHSRTQSHVFHLQTKSYAEHKALQNYYEDVVDLIDEITESYQGKYGIIEGYKSYDIVKYQNNSQIIKYFQDLENDVEKLRETIKESYLQSEIDNVTKLINSTIYKLKYLK